MKSLLKSLALVTLAAIVLQAILPDQPVAAAIGLTQALFATAGLRRVAYGGFLDAASSDPVAYHSYVTNDTLAAVMGAGYFNEAYARLKVNDLIDVSYDLDGAPGHERLRVTASSSAGVTVALEDAGSSVSGVAAGYRMARGQLATTAAVDTVVTGLATVVAAVAVLDDDPVAGVQDITCSIGNQAGAPAAGSILIKGWKATATADTALIAATTFAKKVNWIAIGT